MSSIPEILTALKTVLEPIGVEVYDYVPDSPNYPTICAYLESWPYALFDPNQEAVFVLLCLAGTTDMQDAQTTLMGWLSDTGTTSICAALDANNTLGGVVSSVLPFQVRSWRPELDPSGKRVLAAEIELHILR